MIQDVTSSPDTPGFELLDATMLLLWSGPGLTLAPDIAAVVTAETGENFPLDPTVDVDFPTWAPPGFAIQADVNGPYPTRVQQPVLDVYSSEGTLFHEALIPIDPIPPPAPVPPLPPPDGPPGMSVAGVADVTPGPLTVAVSTAGKPQVFGRGSPTVRFGGDDDYLDMGIGLDIKPTGSSDVSMDGLQFQLFDSTWEVQTPDLAGAPGAPTDTLPAESDASLAMLFETDVDITGARLLSLGLADTGPPGTYAVAAYDADAMTAGERLFDQLMTALLDHLTDCRRNAPAGKPTVVDARVTVASPTGSETAIIKSRDEFADRAGAPAGGSDDTYTLVHAASGWSVSGASGSSVTLKPC